MNRATSPIYARRRRIATEAVMAVVTSVNCSEARRARTRRERVRNVDDGGPEWHAGDPGRNNALQSERIQGV
jgi:hypothetical protein